MPATCALNIAGARHCCRIVHMYSGALAVLNFLGLRPGTLREHSMVLLQAYLLT